MNREQLTEKWYQYIRYYCIEGTIDVWAGDSANNPNNETKSKINMNQSTCFVRLNGGMWIPHWGRFKKYLNIDVAELHQYFTAEEIWKEYYLGEIV
jgi:hypothetical protein